MLDQVGDPENRSSQDATQLKPHSEGGGICNLTCRLVSVFAVYNQDILRLCSLAGPVLKVSMCWRHSAHNKSPPF